MNAVREETIFEDAEDMNIFDDRIFKEDSRLRVEFYQRAILNSHASAKEGRPIHETRDFIRISIPGNKLTSIDTLVTDEYKRRFHRQWAMYKDNVQEVERGTFINEWREIGLATAADLVALNIRTVEQLATISDESVSRIPGGVHLREKARKYLEASESAAVATRLVEEKEAQEAIISDLQEQIAELRKQIAAKK
jgi:hypothetical protein